MNITDRPLRGPRPSVEALDVVLSIATVTLLLAAIAAVIILLVHSFRTRKDLQALRASGTSTSAAVIPTATTTAAPPRKGGAKKGSPGKTQEEPDE